MKEVSGFNITDKEFKLLSKKAETVYNIAVVVDYFCVTQQEIEELYNLTPIIKNLRAKADFFLHAFFDNPGEENIKTSKDIQILFKKCSKDVLLSLICASIYFYSNDDFRAINGSDLKIKIPSFFIIEEIFFNILFFNGNTEQFF